LLSLVAQVAVVMLVVVRLAVVAQVAIERQQIKHLQALLRSR
jgi:hypothetical protein